MSSSKQIRDQFRHYFAERGHEVVRSGPLVPPNDPTLMFANAGMVQFKDVFTGKETRPYRRACSAQRCIRISGKHNDLENVGLTARHHTFFEMLGNFSFGDYFKEEAIKFGWQFLTEVMGISPERLAVTVFGGEGAIGPDTEAEEIWRSVSELPDKRILRCGAKDNFWQMGDTGPCGPCSEIHYYVGSERADISRFGQEPGLDGTGWVELWNLVFMQFEREPGGSMEPLPAPSIDTGAGLERLAAVSQRVYSNYDTDLLRPIVDLAASIAQKPYRGGAEADDMSMRVIADHARITAFLIADGIFPDRDGRAYVLRRVMRRAIRHAHRLGISRPCLHECALKVVELMGDEYHELVDRRKLIEEVTRQEEERFRATLKRGLERIDQVIKPLKQRANPADTLVMSGGVAFELYDTYGFPLDLQEVIAVEQGFAIDRAGFEQEMAKARERSAGSKVGEAAIDHIYHALSSSMTTEFVGYETEEATSNIEALLIDKSRVEALSAGQNGELFLRVTPFYAESGGQVGDRGKIETSSGTFEVLDTVRPLPGLVAHIGKVVSGTVKVGESATLTVDRELRWATRRNHSATHLLHLGLRKVVGGHALQKGSLVGPNRLRFDYSGAKPLSEQQLAEIETLVARQIVANHPVVTDVLAFSEAKSRGAIGIFEEKYGDVVRMVQMGESKELCGGVHVARTGDIGVFKIVSEAGIAAGVRRIEAATGLNALEYVNKIEEELRLTASLVKAAPFETREKVSRLVQQQRELQREIERLTRELASQNSANLDTQARQINGVTVLAAKVAVTDIQTMREQADKLRDKLAPAVVCLGSVAADGKAILVCTVSKDLTKRFHAGQLVKQLAAMVGGSGGGRPDFAQAGGPNGAEIDRPLQAFYGLIGQ
jgi:alanyl-tRNA synthetase